jgi:hypothetical protein
MKATAFNLYDVAMLINREGADDDLGFLFPG